MHKGICKKMFRAALFSMKKYLKINVINGYLLYTKLWYTHETEYDAIIKNDLIDVYEHEKKVQGKIKQEVQLLRCPPSSIKLNQVLPVILLIRSSIFPILNSSQFEMIYLCLLDNMCFLH